MPTSWRTVELRPSAATTSRAAMRLPSDRVAKASASRAITRAVAVPGRKVTFGNSRSRATISRRNSQFGRFHPKGWSEISAASKSFTMRGSATGPPASTIRMICKGAACGASRSQSPAACKTGMDGCKNAVERWSAPVASRSVTGASGSVQITENPAEPKAAAAVNPATPPPETRISVLIRSILTPCFQPRT